MLVSHTCGTPKLSRKLQPAHYARERPAQHHTWRGGTPCRNGTPTLSVRQVVSHTCSTPELFCQGAPELLMQSCWISETSRHRSDVFLRLFCGVRCRSQCYYYTMIVEAFNRTTHTYIHTSTASRKQVAVRAGRPEPVPPPLQKKNTHQHANKTTLCIHSRAVLDTTTPNSNQHAACAAPVVAETRD
jgi:hypothetical protein